MIDLNAVIEQAHTLKPLPASVSRLAQLIAADAEHTELVEVITFDSGLTGQILKMANSAAVGGKARIGRVQDAVVRLGRGAILSLAVASTVRTEATQALPQYGLKSGELWKQGVAAAVCAEIIIALSPKEVSPEAFTAGLLHDLGKLVLARFLAADVLHVIEMGRESGLSPLQAESEILGVHHGELGALVAQSWNLPEGIVQAISHHHTPDLVQLPVVDVTSLAACFGDRLVKLDSTDVHTLLPGPLERLKLDAKRVKRIQEIAERRFEQVSQNYGV